MMYFIASLKSHVADMRCRPKACTGAVTVFVFCVPIFTSFLDCTCVCVSAFRCLHANFGKHMYTFVHISINILTSFVLAVFCVPMSTCLCACTCVHHACIHLCAYMHLLF